MRGRGRGKYICEECGIRCKKPSMLKKHIRTHTDVRPYVCKFCNFAFKTKGEWRGAPPPPLQGRVGSSVGFRNPGAARMNGECRLKGAPPFRPGGFNLDRAELVARACRRMSLGSGSKVRAVAVSRWWMHFNFNSFLNFNFLERLDFFSPHCCFCFHRSHTERWCSQTSSGFQ